jgi:hypothetical protein
MRRLEHRHEQHLRARHESVLARIELGSLTKERDVRRDLSVRERSTERPHTEGDNESSALASRVRRRICRHEPPERRGVSSDPLS